MKFALVLLATLFGADVKVSSPETARVGQPVLIDASDSVGEVTFDTADEQLVIFAQIRGGKQALVQRLKPGVGRFTVTAKDEHGTSTSRELILFEGEEPAPAPAPQPDKPKPPIGPAKPLPAGKFNVSVPCRDEACKVPSSTRTADAEALAAKLLDIRTRIAAGAIVPNTKAVVSEVVAAARQLPVATQKLWAPWLDHWWNSLVKKAHDTKTLASKTDWLQLFDESILGLKAVQ